MPFLAQGKTNWKYILLAVLSVLFFGSQASADLIVPRTAAGFLLIEFILTIAVNFVINFVILTIAYLILRKANLIKSLAYLKYILFVTIGGYLIDFIFVYGQFLTGYKGPIIGVNVSDPELLRKAAMINMIFIILTSICLFIYNYWLSKKSFRLTKMQAVFIGLIMGILTNPAILTFLKIDFLIPSFF